MTLEALFEFAKNQWTRAKTDKKHPFRFFTLATVSPEGLPKTRMVVLRDFDSQKLEFTIYADARSQKVIDLQQENKAQLFFYHPKKKVQLIVNAVLQTQDAPQEIFSRQPENSIRDYTSKLPPGTPFSQDEGIEYETDKNYFTRLVFHSISFEILQLDRTQHQRALFTADEQDWKKQFLVT
jgi:pyridoxamine 5'-phosphate oxidase